MAVTTPAVSISLIERLSGWYISNQIFMIFICAAIFFDHLLGSYVHAKIKKDFSWKKNRDGLFIKFGGSLIGYVLFEMLQQIVKDVDFIAIYLKVLLQLVTFFYPFFSAIVNLSIATGGKFPSKGLMKKFVKFEDEADLKIFKTKIDETDNDDFSVDSSADELPK